MKVVKLPKGKVFDFKSARKSGKYHWDTFFDGNLNCIVAGEDFPADAEMNYMPSKLKFAGRHRYLNVKVSRVDHEGNQLPEGHLWVQSFPMTAEERVAEDKSRAEAKLRAKARKADESNAATTESDEASAEETATEEAAA